MSEPTVFIVDDDPSARRGLTRLVRAAGMQAEAFASASAFLSAGKTGAPGCLVLDVRMPQMTGPELQVALARAEHYIPIVFLSAHGDVPMTAQAMKHGAVDFLTKPVDRDDLLQALGRAIGQDADARARRAEEGSVQDRIKTLTAREHEIMTYVITGMLNKQIAAELGISLETVKVHRGHVMRKLGVVSVVQLVHLCEKAGIAPAEIARS
jgi:FixJ family two-component response regulator